MLIRKSLKSLIIIKINLQRRTIKMKNILPSNYRCCATCRNWGGCRRPNPPLNTVVEYEMNDNGVCYITNLPTVPNLNCSKWEQQFKR